MSKNNKYALSYLYQKNQTNPNLLEQPTLIFFGVICVFVFSSVFFEFVPELFELLEPLNECQKTYSSQTRIKN